MTTKILIVALTVVLLLSCIFILTSCKAEKHKVICAEGIFSGVKKGYKAGDKVKVYFSMVATDTDYTFYLDGERISPSAYSDLKGYTIEFTMPAKNVTLDYESKNSMENPYQTFDEITTLVTYTKRISTAIGDEVYEVTLESTDIEYEHKMTVYHEDGNKSVYTVPIHAYGSLRNYTESMSLWNWNDLEKYECLDGKVTSFSILYEGEYITISTDQMPEDGEAILNYLHSHLTDYMTEDYKVE